MNGTYYCDKHKHNFFPKAYCPRCQDQLENSMVEFAELPPPFEEEKIQDASNKLINQITGTPPKSPCFDTDVPGANPESKQIPSLNFTYLAVVEQITVNSQYERYPYGFFEHSSAKVSLFERSTEKPTVIDVPVTGFQSYLAKSRRARVEIKVHFLADGEDFHFPENTPAQERDRVS